MNAANANREMGIEDGDVEELVEMIRALKQHHAWTINEMTEICASVGRTSINGLLRGERTSARTIERILNDLQLSELELRGWYAKWTRLKLY